jgi:vacuolar-type H+-ATPase subunit H
MAVKIAALKSRSWFDGLLWKFDRVRPYKGKLATVCERLPDEAIVGLSNGKLVVYAATSRGKIVPKDIIRFVSEGGNWGADPPSFIWSDLLANLIAEACPEILAVPELEDGIRMIRAVPRANMQFYFCFQSDAPAVEAYEAKDRKAKKGVAKRETGARQRIRRLKKRNEAVWKNANEKVNEIAALAEFSGGNSQYLLDLRAAENARDTLREAFKSGRKQCPHTKKYMVPMGGSDAWHCDICERDI